MVGRVLTKNRGLTEKHRDHYSLIGAGELSKEQKVELIALCQQRIDEFEAARGEPVWAHRKRGHRPISGSVRYEVLKRAKFRCELCGLSGQLRGLSLWQPCAMKCRECTAALEG
jgi:ATP adenylyltransferase